MDQCKEVQVPGSKIRKIESVFKKYPFLQEVIYLFIPEGKRSEEPGKTFTLRALLIVTLAIIAGVTLGIVSPYHNPGWMFGEGDIMTWASFFMLLTVSYLCHKIWYLRGGVPPVRKEDDIAVWRYLGYGFTFLAFDELCRIHESVDRYLHKALGVKPTELTDHLDDLFIALYGVAGLTLLIKYRKEIFKYLHAWPYMAFAALCTGATIFFDFFSGAKFILRKIFTTDWDMAVAITVLDIIEETFKIYAEIFFVGTFASIFFVLCRKACNERSQDPAQ